MLFGLKYVVSIKIISKAQRNVNVCAVGRFVQPQIRSIYAIARKAKRNVNICIEKDVLLGLKYVVSMQ